jgi:serine/threonine protein kinase
LNLGPGFDQDFKDLIEVLLKKIPEERATAGTLIHEKLQSRVQEYVNSEDFKEEWMLSRQRPLLMNSENKLFVGKISEATALEELNVYIEGTKKES